MLTKLWCSYIIILYKKQTPNRQEKNARDRCDVCPVCRGRISGRVTYVRVSCLLATKTHLAPLTFKTPNCTLYRRRPPQTGILTWWYRMVNPYPGGCNRPRGVSTGEENYRGLVIKLRGQDELIKPLLNQLNHDTWSQVWACQLTGYYHKRVPHMVLLYFNYIFPVPRTGWWRT